MAEPIENISVEPETKETKKRGRPKKEIKYNEKGERLTAKGTVDKRRETSIKNLEKSVIYQDIMKAKEARAEKVKVEIAQIPDESESEEEEEPDEFEIEEYIVKPKGEPQVVEVEKIVEKIVEKEIIKPDPREKERIRKLELANKELAKNVAMKEKIKQIQFMRDSFKW